MSLCMFSILTLVSPMAKSIEVVEVVRRNLGPAPASIMLLLVTVIVEASLLLRSVFAPYETP